MLWRAKSDIDLPVLEVLSDGTYRSRIAEPAAAKRLRRQGADPTDPTDIPGIDVRVIEYSVAAEDGSEVSETFVLITDILDPQQLSAEQAAAAYAQRWQLETCFDELETSIRGGAAVVLRSKSPPLIRQEIYAMLCCYQAIRTLISHAADTAEIDPSRISFTRARDAIQGRISDPGCFSPPALDDLLTDLAFEVTLPRHLVPPRPDRRYKRETNRASGRYKTRRPDEPARLTPLTVIKYWRLPKPT